MTDNITFRTHNDIDINIINTGLRGYIDAGYDRLVKVFGEPIEGEYKTSAEWHIQFGDGIIATIYDYKTGKNYLGDEGLDAEDTRDWHVGGRTGKIVVDRIKELLGINSSQRSIDATGYYMTESTRNLWDHGETPKCHICGDKACYDTPTSMLQLCDNTTCSILYVEQESDHIILVDDGKAPCIDCETPTEPAPDGELKGEFICTNCREVQS